MRQLSKVVWHEGMHLSQHHFQAQSRYFEDAIHFALSQLFPNPYGLAGIALDAEALHNGTVSLLHARGLLPDGLAFNIPEGDPAPEPREIRDAFSPTQDSHVVLLALPAFRRDGANTTGLDGQNGAAPLAAPRAGTLRFHHEALPMVDETLGRDERAVGVGRKSFRLLLDTEVGEDDVALPLARVRRSGAGNFVYDPEYIPPILQIGASERLVQLLRRIVEMLDVKGETLGARRRPDALGEFAANEVASFWLLHAMHASLAPLRHHLDSRRTTPDALYTELARLAGALCTFSLQSHPRTLPAYDHDRLEETFGLLDRHIRDHLNVIIPDSCLRIPLVRESNVLHTAAAVDPRLYAGRSRWILAVRGNMTPSEIAQRVPQFVKVCAQKFVLRLVERALPGLSLEPIGSPPPAVAPRSDTTYFALGRLGPCWDTIVQTQQVGVYVPDAIPGAELELLVVLEG
jgi:type VI secretion system protein ImpJ